MFEPWENFEAGGWIEAGDVVVCHELEPILTVGEFECLAECFA